MPPAGDNPEFPVGPPAEPGGPAHFGGVPDTRATQEALTAMARSSVALSDSVKELVGHLSAAYDKLAAMADKMESVSGRVKDTVISSDRLGDNLKTVDSIAKGFELKLLSQKKTYNDLKAHIEEQIELVKELGKKQADAFASSALGKHAAALKAKLEEVAKTAKEKFEVPIDVLKELEESLGKTARQVGSLGQSFGRMELGRVEHHVSTIAKAWRDAGVQVKLFDRLEEHAVQNKAAREVKAAAQARRGRHAAEYQAKMEAAGPAIAKILGRPLPRTAKGGVDWEELRTGAPAKTAGPAEDIGKLASQLAFRGGKGGFGLGRFDTFLGRRALEAKAAAIEDGEGAPGAFSLGRGLIRAQEAGGGSVLGGITEMAGGALAKAGPYAAIGAAIGEAVTSFWDTRAKTNQAIERGMGGALFTPGMTGGQALNTVRQNLSANVFNAFGQNLERNLAIAQAMQESGLDITELARGNVRNKPLAGGGRPDTTAGFLGGTFGEFQRNVMTAGRVAGLTDQQTVVRMTKMIHEMRQTFEATHDFLEGVNTQARAAGMSTTKYLSIVDDLTSQFDKMNKSFNESVSLIQALGSSGAQTADDISDMAKAMTGAGENKTIEQNAAAFTFMSKDQRRAMTISVQKSVKEASDALEQAMGPGPHTWAEGLDLSNPTDLMMLQNQLPSNMEANQRQNIMKAAERKRYSLGQLSIAERVERGDVAGAAIAMKELGGGAELMTGAQAALMSKMLPGGTFQKLLENPNLDIKEAVMAGQPLGYKPEDFQQVLKSIVALGNTLAPERVAELQKTGAGALSEDEKDKRLRRYFEYGKRMHVFSKDEQYNQKKMLETLNDNAKMSKIIAEEVAEHPEEFQEGLHQERLKTDQAAQDEQAKQVALQTRPTADIYANAFEYLFKQIVDVVQDIADFLHAGGPKANKQVEAQLATPAVMAAGKTAYQGALSLAQGGDTEARKAAVRMEAYQRSERHTAAEQAQYVRDLKKYGKAEAVKALTAAGVPEPAQLEGTGLVGSAAAALPGVGEVMGAKTALDAHRERQQDQQTLAAAQAQTDLLKKVQAIDPGAALNAYGTGITLSKDIGDKQHLEQMKAIQAIVGRTPGAGYETNPTTHESHINITYNSTEVQANIASGLAPVPRVTNTSPESTRGTPHPAGPANVNSVRQSSPGTD